MWLNKHGISVWISWVLVVGFAVTLGTFFFNWASDLSTEKGEELITRNSESVLCDRAALSVRGICQNTQTLNINVSNTGNVMIDTLRLILIDIYNQPDARSASLDLLPGKQKQVEVVKQGALTQAVVMPVINDDGKRFVCQQRAVTEDGVEFC